MATDRRNPDASKLTFPLQLVIAIGVMLVGAYMSQANLRSDVRDILTRLELGRDTSRAQSAAQEERLNALKASIDSTAATMRQAIEAVSKKQELQALQIAELKDAITKLSATTGRK